VQLLADVAEHRRAECWWLVLRDGTLIPGDHGGGVMLLAQLQRTRWAAQVLSRLRLSRPVDLLDQLLARTRKHLGRLVPQGEAPVRFP
jgi:hypothetical protein